MTSRSTFRCMAFLLAVSLSVPSFAGGTLVVQLPATQDNTLYEDAEGDVSNGAGERLFIGMVANQGGGALRRALLAFDLTGTIPSDAIVTSVSMELQMSRSIGGEFNASLHKVTTEWGEGSSDALLQEGRGAAATADDATWIHSFFDTIPWTTSGGDFDAVASDAIPVTSAGTYSWGSTTQMIADVQSWVDDPASNFGWILIGNETNPTPTAKRFESRTGTDFGDRPRLLLEFSSASAIFIGNFETGDFSEWSSSTAP